MLPVKKPKMEHVQADHELFLQAFESECVGGFEGKNTHSSSILGSGHSCWLPPLPRFLAGSRLDLGVEGEIEGAVPPSGVTAQEGPKSRAFGGGEWGEVQVRFLTPRRFTQEVRQRGPHIKSRLLSEEVTAAL